jgi:prefoldin subunit 5
MQKGKSRTGVSRFDQLNAEVSGFTRRVQHLEAQVGQLRRDMATLADVIDHIVTAARKSAEQENDSGQ